MYPDFCLDIVTPPHPRRESVVLYSNLIYYNIMNYNSFVRVLDTVYFYWLIKRT